MINTTPSGAMFFFHYDIETSRCGPVRRKTSPRTTPSDRTQDGSLFEVAMLFDPIAKNNRVIVLQDQLQYVI